MTGWHPAAQRMMDQRSTSVHGGQQLVSESMAGTFTYTLTCESTAAPMTASASVKIAATSGGTMTGGMSGSSSGGGGMDLLTLIGLISALAAQVAGRALKTKAGVRVVPLSGWLVAELAAHGNASAARASYSAHAPGAR